MTEFNKLQGSYTLLAGSISSKTDDAKIELAHKFVESFVEKVIESGGGFVVYLSGECLNINNKPLLFDWSIVSIIDRLLPDASEKVRLKVVASDKVLKEKATAEQRRLLSSMVNRGLASRVHIERKKLTGGAIVDEQIHICTEMVCLGGGKGVFGRATKMSDSSLPVIALDLEIGGLSDDGNGALDVLEEFQANPEKYLPHTGDEVLQFLDSLSLENCVQSYSSIAQRIIDIFYNEEIARIESLPPDVLIITAIDVELAAIKRVLGIDDNTAANKVNNNLNVWDTKIICADASEIKCAVAILGEAGIPNAASVTSTLINALQPKNIIMLGIAGGMPDKFELGDVVFAELIIGYEGAALIADNQVELRPKHYNLRISIRQDINAYIGSNDQLRERLTDAREFHNIKIHNQDAKPQTITPKLATIASGNKLFKDEIKFNELKSLHGKVAVVEMEGEGVFAACEQSDTPVLMIRGISDNGNDKKNDDFHKIAAITAAIVTKDFIVHGLNLKC